MRRWFILFALLAAAQFCLHLGRQDITASHEGRVAQTAREMVESGDWLIPHLGGKVRLQKPPLPYWAAAMLWKISGTLDVALARLPAAICGILCALIMIDLGRKCFGRTGGILCGLIWLSTFFIVDEFRKAMADPYLAFFALVAVWAWIRSVRLSFFILFWLALGLGILAKGPFILLHVAIAVMTYHLSFCRRIRIGSGHVIGIVLFLLIAAPWPLYLIAEVPDVVEVWKHESLGEAAGARNPQPFYKYLEALPLTSAPWTLIALVGAILPFAHKRKRARLLLWPLLWLAATIVIFSLAPQKKNAYLLPAMPAQTLLIAGALRLMIRSRRWRFVLPAHAFAAAIAVVVVYVMIWRATWDAGRANYAAGIASTVAIIVSIAAVQSALAMPRAARTAMLTALAFAAAVHGIVAWLRPDFENRRSPVPFIVAVNSTVGESHLALAGFISEDVLFYLRRGFDRFDQIADLPVGFEGYVLVDDANLQVLQSAHPNSRVIATMPQRRPSERTCLVLIGPTVAHRAPAR